MYKSIEIDFNDLVLDDQNPRFVTNSTKNITNKDIMNYLIEFEEVVELAEKIKAYGGLVPGERLLVTKSNSKYIVLEGNRRTAAITIILNPNKILDSLSISTRYTRKISDLRKNISSELKNSLSKFYVDEVSTRDDAIYSLTQRHIDGIKTWSQISKMFFYQQHFENGKDLKALKSFTGESTASIKDSLRKYSFLRMVLDSYKKLYPKGRYSDSNIETTIPTELIISRIYNSLKGPLKFKFENNTFKMSTNEYNVYQKELLTNILAKISYLYWDLKKINTRNLNTKDNFQEVFFNSKNSLATIEEAIEIGKLIKQLEASLKNPTLFDDDIDSTNNDSPEQEQEQDLSSIENSLDNPGNNNGIQNNDTNETDESDQKQDNDSEIEETKRENDPGNKREYNKRQKEPKKRNYPFKGINYSGNVIGISQSLFELHKIDIKIFSLATTVLIRTFLECTLQDYIMANNFNIKVKNGIPVKELSIDSLLKECTDSSKGNFQQFEKKNRHVARVLRESFQKRDPDELNIVAHGNHREPSIDALWEIERRWYSAVKIMIEEISGHIK
ncbi:ParB/Srx family N-terminal domain-containing protein [Ornithinibacillus xuwenensis]|uniref:ParB/Srx family N-terminal domain-containing protein n=1 Tax=Ornithinibacillus xuwenensis TaxID=3144668 RepID=A0ABU9XBM0_9BACI